MTLSTDITSAGSYWSMQNISESGFAREKETPPPEALQRPLVNEHREALGPI